MSHDVDWPRQGPQRDHIISIKDRFEKDLFENTNLDDLYYNFPEYMEIEEKFNVRSTFFFRTKYETGDFREYEDDIKSLIKGGWEVALHSDPSSVSNIDKLSHEKIDLESVTKTAIKGNRVHFLKFNEELPKKLLKLGFAYDSSTRKSKDRIDKNEMGFNYYETLVEFPVTIMDAYLFTYMKLKERDIVPIFQSTLEYSRKLNLDVNVITVLWHDNVLKMKGGRMYPKILEFLTSQDDVRICKGIDLAKMINEKSLNY